MGMVQRLYCRKGSGEVTVPQTKSVLGMEIGMIQINQVKMAVGHTPEQLRTGVAKLLRIPEKDILKMDILRQSIDARKMPHIIYTYTVNVALTQENKVWKRLQGIRLQIQRVEPVEYRFPKCSKAANKKKVVIVGTGPAGLFCGYYLALQGYCPILLERGKDVDTRTREVEEFWKGGKLNPESNVQFGEGGAGTFSDGKLNTLVKDKSGRNREVLRCFVQFGAKESILYEAKPHIGTDVLSGIVKGMREEIIRLGGSVRFESCMTDMIIADGKITEVVVNEQEHLSCDALVLAIGHSARDTFAMLQEREIPMEAKSFAVGLRVEHPQSLINLSQYGMEDPGALGAAPYKVTAKTSSGRGVYSFCMCPGGYVVNASSEPGRLCVNGMSYSGRDGKNANSAIIVSVTPEDFGGIGPLAGIAFQRRLEEKAYQLAEGRIPAQRYGEFRARVRESAGELVCVQECDGANGPEQNRKSVTYKPACKGDYAWADVSSILPKVCNEAFVEGMEVFGRQIKGFDREDGILLGVESRTSSPVRIMRDDNLQAYGVVGLYPCGEGAGYAGGITSAAMDGLRVAEAIVLSDI